MTHRNKSEKTKILLKGESWVYDGTLKALTDDQAALDAGKRCCGVFPMVRFP